MNVWKGLAFTLVFAVPAYFLGQYFPIIGGPVFGILLGMVFASVWRPAVLEEGIAYTGKKVLQYSIILLGFEMNLYHVLDTGAKSVSVMVCTLATAFLVAIVVGKLLHLEFKTTTLIGAGTAICGGISILAVGNPISRPRRSPCTTFPCRAKGCPSRASAVSIWPIVTRRRMTVLLIGVDRPGRSSRVKAMTGI